MFKVPTVAASNVCFQFLQFPFQYGIVWGAFIVFHFIVPIVLFSFNRGIKNYS